MEKLLQNKYIKYGVIILAVLLLIVFIFNRFGSKSSFGGLTDSISPKDFQTQELIDGDKYSSYGMIMTTLEDITYFSLKDANYSITINFSNMELDGKKLKDVDMSKFNVSDYVLVNGIYDQNTKALYATKVTKIEKEKITAYKRSKMPILEVKLVDAPTDVSHSCRNIVLSVKLTNIGDIPVSYEDIYSSDYHFRLAYSINNVISYTTTTIGDTEEIGYVGVKHFSLLNPGDSTTVKIGLGGMVTSNVNKERNAQVGISGEYNLLYPSGREGGKLGANEIKILWVSLYDEDGILNKDNPMILGSTDTFSINLLSADCDMEDIQETVTLD